MFELPDVAIGAIAAALITGVLSFVGLILGKDQKISEFRQAWIDALRKDISALIANANVIAGFRATADSQTKAYEIFKEARQNYVAINEAEASIRMRLNAGEKSSRLVLFTLGEMEGILDPEETEVDHKLLDLTGKKLVTEMNFVLKQEWRRVKRGEPIYFVAKYIALLVVLTIVCFGIANATHPGMIRRLAPSSNSKL